MAGLAWGSFAVLPNKKKRQTKKERGYDVKMTRKRLSKKMTDELKRIATTQKGRITKEIVLDEAQDPTNPLHPYFEWDNSEAARRYRLLQAQELIQLAVEVVGEEKIPQRIFVNLRDDRRAKGGYSFLVDVLNDEQRRRQLINDAAYDIQIFKDKYETLKELTKVFAAMNKFQKKHKTKKK